MIIQNVICIQKKINHTHIKHYAGFFSYVKLTFKLWKISYQNSKKLSFFQKFLLFVELFLTSLYAIFIKPFFQFFSFKTSIKGSFKSFNYQIPKQHDVKKYVTFRLFNIPLFFFKSKLTNEDWQNLLK